MSNFMELPQYEHLDPQSPEYKLSGLNVVFEQGEWTHRDEMRERREREAAEKAAAEAKAAQDARMAQAYGLEDGQWGNPLTDQSGNQYYETKFGKVPVSAMTGPNAESMFQMYSGGDLMPSYQERNADRIEGMQEENNPMLSRTLRNIDIGQGTLQDSMASPSAKQQVSDSYKLPADGLDPMAYMEKNGSLEGYVPSWKREGFNSSMEKSMAIKAGLPITQKEDTLQEGRLGGANYHNWNRTPDTASELRGAAMRESANSGSGSSGGSGGSPNFTTPFSGTGITKLGAQPVLAGKQAPKTSGGGLKFGGQPYSGGGSALAGAMGGSALAGALRGGATNG